MSTSEQAAGPASSAESRTARRAEELAQEQALFAAARQGSVAALDQLIERLAEQLWRDAQGQRKPRGLGPSTGLSDLVQDTLILVRESFDQFVRHSFADFRQWARTILFNRLQGRARVHRSRSNDDRLQRFVQELQARVGRESWREPVDQEVARREEAARVYRLFQSLPAHERNIIQLRLLEGLRYREIAELTEITAEAARTKYRRALAHLKQLYDPHAPG